MRENLLRMRLINVTFACIIAVGVVYNAARIALSERGRELATLRVIGFTR
jgi:putative ABC transport system permease protein